jgi:uncharacterized protein YndB with AHSA1/START domain
MVPESIEREILIDAAVEIVWSVVTEPEHVGTWFSDAAELDLRPGGEGLLTWREHGASRLRVETVEPPHVFAFRWLRGTGSELRAGNSTLVEMRLSAEGGSTRLRVIESGFRDLDWPEDEQAEYAEGNTRGWRVELDELREYVATRFGASARR